MKQEKFSFYTQHHHSFSKWYFEEQYWQLQFRNIAGLDEAGRGSLSGPVVAAAVIFPHTLDIAGLDDSKKLSPAVREALFIEIRKHARAIGIGLAHQAEVDEVNVLEATRFSMIRAIERLTIQPDLLLIDAVDLPRSNIPYHAIIKGDSKSASIAAASIIAKVVRDRIMIAHHRHFPAYNFNQNKGYGTREHRTTIQKVGICALHRKTFQGVKEYLD
ncbi:ribonuclease HII [candidate division CSSED10-310 bacterium]|uniref:Ribonuclease HII n=1 Tax=candidate division CSSED10-310 bacterium TaxID=2855610 RepID=A0ABV6YZ71_UNCC1